MIMDGVTQGYSGLRRVGETEGIGSCGIAGKSGRSQVSRGKVEQMKKTRLVCRNYFSRGR